MKPDLIELKNKLSSAEKKESTKPDLKSILEKTQISSPTFEQYISKIIKQKQTRKNHAEFFQPKEHSISKLKTFLKALLINSTKAVITSAMRFFANEFQNFDNAICVFGHGGESAGNGSYSENVDLHLLIRSSISLENVLLSFKKGSLSRIECSCLDSDIYRCEHAVLALLAIFSTALNKLAPKDPKSVSSKISHWSVFKDFGLCPKTAEKLLFCNYSPHYIEKEQFKTTLKNSSDFSINLKKFAIDTFEKSSFEDSQKDSKIGSESALEMLRKKIYLNFSEAEFMQTAEFIQPLFAIDEVLQCAVKAVSENSETPNDDVNCRNDVNTETPQENTDKHPDIIDLDDITDESGLIGIGEESIDKSGAKNGLIKAENVGFADQLSNFCLKKMMRALRLYEPKDSDGVEKSSGSRKRKIGEVDEIETKENSKAKHSKNVTEKVPNKSKNVTERTEKNAEKGAEKITSLKSPKKQKTTDLNKTDQKPVENKAEKHPEKNEKKSDSISDSKSDSKTDSKSGTTEVGKTQTENTQQTDEKIRGNQKENWLNLREEEIFKTEQELCEAEFEDICQRAVGDDFGFSKECCGCQCHKAVKRLKIVGKDMSCEICQDFHRRDTFIFKLVIENIFKCIDSHTKLALNNYTETQNAIYIFKKVSFFYFYISKRIKTANLNTKTVKKSLSLFVSSIFTRLLLSFDVHITNYVDLIILIKSWKEETSLGSIPEQGWHGKEIEGVLNKQTTEFEERSKTSKERIACLQYSGRFNDGLIYCLAIKDYFNAGKFLALLGRLVEAKECLKCVYTSQAEAFEFAKIFAKKDRQAAFDYFAETLLSKKKIKSFDELEWLVKVCEKAEKRNEKLEKLVKEITFAIKTEALKNLISSMASSGLEESALTVIFRDFFDKKRAIGGENRFWALEMVMRIDSQRAKVFVQKLCDTLHYSYQLPGDISKLNAQLTEKNLYEEAISLANCFLKLYVKKFKRDNNGNADIILNNFMNQDHQNCILELVNYLFKSFTVNTVGPVERKIQLQKTLKLVFEIKNAEFLFEVCKLVAKRSSAVQMDNSTTLHYAKKLFVLQFSFSRKDSLIREILKWILATASENQKLFPENKLAGFSSLIIKKEEEEKDKEKRIEGAVEGEKKGVAGQTKDDFADQGKDDALDLESESTSQFSVEAMIKFVCNTLKLYAGSFSQEPLLDVADFMYREKIGNVERIIDLVISALKIGFKSNAQVEKSASNYYNIALEYSIEKAKEIAKLMLRNSPSTINFNRLAALYSEHGVEWKVLLAEVLQAITKKDEHRLNTGNVSKSAEILNLLLQENASADILCGFIKQECCGFKEAEKALELLKQLLEGMRSGKGKKSVIDEETWFCTVHFNIIISTLKGTSVKAKKDFLGYVEKAMPSMVLKTAMTFSQALTLLIEKKVKFVTENDSAEFFDLLQESRFMFEKALKRKEWEVLIESITLSQEETWFKTKLAEWRAQNSFSPAMILIDE